MDSVLLVPETDITNFWYHFDTDLIFNLHILIQPNAICTCNVLAVCILSAYR